LLIVASVGALSLKMTKYPLPGTVARQLECRQAPLPSYLFSVDASVTNASPVPSRLTPISTPTAHMPDTGH
jgi:hypothetical protein